VRFLVTGLTGNFFGDDLAADVERLVSDLAGGATDPFFVIGFFALTGFATGFLVFGFSDEIVFDFAVGWTFGFLSEVASVAFFGAFAGDFGGTAATFAVDFAAVAGGGVILVECPVFADPASFDVFEWLAFEGDFGWACLVFEEVRCEPTWAEAAIWGVSVLDLVPLEGAFPSVCFAVAATLAGLGGGGGGGGGGGALGLLVMPRSLKTATTSGFL